MDPTSEFVRFSEFGSWIFARPKSVSFTWPSLSSRMFSGLRSRCMMLSECRCPMAQTISAM